MEKTRKHDSKNLEIKQKNTKEFFKKQKYEEQIRKQDSKNLVIKQKNTKYV